MPDYSKVFNYEVDGLAYTVSLYEVDGEFFADISVIEGAMDVNAIYFGDDGNSGPSASLDGPLNMNGARLDGERVQWDDAVPLSDPGLGPDGEDKETYLSEGDTLTVPLDIDSLDEIDVFGIRATSTTTDEGSIKGVSGDPEEPEEPEEPGEPTYDKVFFGESFTDDGSPLGGVFILEEEPVPNTFNNAFLPEGTEPTFENYLAYFESEAIGGDVTSIEAITFYENDENGVAQEVFRIEAPDGGFPDSDAVLAAYDDALDGMEEMSSGAEDMDLMAALGLAENMDSGSIDEDEETEEEIETL